MLTLALYVAIAFTGPRLVGTRPLLLVLLLIACVAAVGAWHYRPGLEGRARQRPG